MSSYANNENIYPVFVKDLNATKETTRRNILSINYRGQLTTIMQGWIKPLGTWSKQGPSYIATHEPEVEKGPIERSIRWRPFYQATGPSTRGPRVYVVS
jgi:hypothetical protein